MLDKWDKQYADKPTPGEPASVLAENLHLLPSAGASLDLACGLGANALMLAERQFSSYAYDSSAVALEKLAGFAAARGVTVIGEQRDVETQPPAPEQFDVIVVSHFLHRPLCAALVSALKPRGLLFYQTFTQRKLSSRGPKNSAFLLAPQELLSLFSALDIRYYREDDHAGIEPVNPDSGAHDSHRNLAYLVAQKR